MEKLIELLNKYEKEIKKSEFYEWEIGIGGGTNLFRRDTRDEEGSHIYFDTADTYVISKKYGFIGWLVDNDKIDLEEIGIDYGRIHLVGEESGRQHIIRQDLARYEALLMLLSISDTPIDDLISYLK